MRIAEKINKHSMEKVVVYMKKNRKRNIEFAQRENESGMERRRGTD